jgi:multidrug efflux pump subunit AcrB
MDQIEQHQAAGEPLWDAIIDSAIIRFRPITLTAVAAILGMLPLVPNVFWGQWQWQLLLACLVPPY